MKTIHVLSMHIANQIAAGEVVERPASIVKELVENSIDAGATAITVEIEGGGVDYLRVSDNGGGIPAPDVATAFLRHATSKIQTADDLGHIHTLGFRGEALSSIAAVSHVRLNSRVAEAEAGACVEIEGGELNFTGPAAWAEGTSIEVRDIFFNVPARRKFLKSRRAEAAAIGDFLSRIILAHPSIAFRFLNSGKLIYQSIGDGDLKNAVYCVYGSEVLEHLRPIAYDDGAVSISGYLGNEQIARPNRLQQSLYVNGRCIHAPKLSLAAHRAFDTRLMTGRFPFFVMHLRVPWDTVDVNVHPQKLEVRFREEESVIRAVSAACRMALGDSAAPMLRGMDVASFRKQASRFDVDTPAPVADAQASQPLRDKLGSIPQEQMGAPMRETGAAAAFAKPHLAADGSTSWGWREGKDPSAKQSDPDAPCAMTSPTKDGGVSTDTSEQAAIQFGIEPYKAVGQLFDCYWIVQQGDRMFFIDQHAAHERRLYERLMAGEISAASQILLLPSLIKLDPAQFDLVMHNLPAFEELGFSIEEFGALTVRIRAVPDILGQAQTAEFLFDALELLQKQGRMAAAELKRASLIQASCKHAVKAGAVLAPAEIDALLAEYAKQGIPMTCPHGRPVMVQMTKYELEKLFKRVV